MPRKFPLYEMIINGSRRYLTLSEAAAAYDSGWAQVDFGDNVFLEDGTVIPMTDKEKSDINNLADEHSANK